jgi:hypothetical protein
MNLIVIHSHLRLDYYRSLQRVEFLDCELKDESLTLSAAAAATAKCTNNSEKKDFRLSLSRECVHT